MASNRTSVWPVVTAIIAVIVALIALPTQWKQGWLPSFMLRPDFHFGLDLAGGTQLDFRISEEEMNEQLRSVDAEIAALQGAGADTEKLNQLQAEKIAIEQQRTNLVEAIRTVLERRINSLGVSEATITPSYLGGEKHLLVDCPGVVDVQNCIATVGKTIQLEFKEEQSEASPEYAGEVRTNVTAALTRIRQSGATLQVLGQDIGSQLGMLYEENRTYFRSDLHKGLENVWDVRPGSGIIQREGSIKVPQQDANGQLVERDVPGIFLVEVLSPRTSTGRTVNEASTAFKLLETQEQGARYFIQQNVALAAPIAQPLIDTLKAMTAGQLKTVEKNPESASILFLRLLTPGREEVDVSHILVGYQGASEATPDVTRTKAEALVRAQDLKKQLDAGARFEDLASRQSDGPSKANGGKLGPIARGSLVPSFEQIAFTAEVGKVSDPVETPFGFHLIRTNAAAKKTADTASFEELAVTGANAKSRADTIVSRLQAGEVRSQEDAIKLRTLFFSLEPTGWKDTALDGTHFRTANVTLDPQTNRPVVQILFDEEGGTLFQELTRRNIGKQIAIFVGGQLVSAPTVQAEIAGGTAVITGSNDIQEAQLLAQELNTGAIPAPIYLSGQRTVEPTLGSQAISTSVQAALYGILVLMLFMVLIYRALGLLANIALMIYAVIFIALLKLPLFLFSSQYIVLTLAGMAGLILSIGLAIDSNVLVFERIKEELKKGKLLKSAVDIGFEKAWPSIRDSNVSTIITCVLLFIIGTSIVRGFAITLGIGVLISMFTGMVITRWIARKVALSPLADNRALFPGTRATPPTNP